MEKYLVPGECFPMKGISNISGGALVQFTGLSLFELYHFYPFPPSYIFCSLGQLTTGWHWIALD